MWHAQQTLVISGYHNVLEYLVLLQKSTYFCVPDYLLTYRIGIVISNSKLLKGLSKMTYEGPQYNRL